LAVVVALRWVGDVDNMERLQRDYEDLFRWVGVRVTICAQIFLWPLQVWQGDYEDLFR
jgi:hypothetical protein